MQREHLVDRLAQIMARPEYAPLLAQKLKYAAAKEATAWHYAQRTIQYAFGRDYAPKLLEPVVVIEIVPSQFPVQLYRVYDGMDRAMTLGAWWGDRKLLKHCVQTATGDKGELDHAAMLEAMLKAMYVHPNWNRGTDVAKMTIPVGNRTPAIIGQGDWRALREAKVETEEDLEAIGMKGGMGSKQYCLPLFNSMWVEKVPHGWANWPFAAG